MTKICRKCGEKKKDVCKHEWIKTPDGCVCDIDSWCVNNEIPQVCSHFVKGRFGNCKNCEHDEACHLTAEELKTIIIHKLGNSARMMNRLN